MKRNIVLITLSLICLSSKAQQIQTLIAQNPKEALIFTQDVANFWKAYDQMETYKGSSFDDLYISKGSEGVKSFLENNRIVNGDSLKSTVFKRRQDYLNIRKSSLNLKEVESQCRASYYALKYLYPSAVFPPLYFVIGRFNTGGLSIHTMQIIGVEMNSNENITFIVAHELAHAQQKIPYKYKILLEQCIIEGSADFLGELISGKTASRAPYEYAIGKEKDLWEDFQKDMNLGENDDFANWLYAGKRKDARPADMGYYIGYMITKSYYENAKDKKKAIQEILNVKDCKKFLKESKYNPA